MTLRKFGVLALLVLIIVGVTFKIFATAGLLIILLIILVCIFNLVAMKWDDGPTKTTP